MVREISAGGVVVRKRDKVWWMAAIAPPEESESGAPDPSEGAPRKRKPLLALPKGLVDPGEKPLQTALREVREETGITADPIVKLGDIKYVYTRTWAGNERVFKIVSFYLMRYRAGRINNLIDEMRVEVDRALWIPLEEAPRRLAYKGEKEMAKRALEYVLTHTDA